MTIFAASPSPAAGPRRRLRGLLAGPIVCALLLTLLLAAPARAIVAEVESTKVGLQPRSTSLGTPGSTPASFANVAGHAVLHGTNVYPIFWDPEGFGFHHEWLTKIDAFFQQLGESSGRLGTIFASLTQYRDHTNQPAQYAIVYKGSYSDTTPFPPAKCTDPNPLIEGAVTCLTDAQLREQLQAFITSHGLPKGMNTIYYLLTPPGVTVCLDKEASRCSDYRVSKSEEEKEERESISYQESFCSYHAFINPDKAPEGDGSTILYAAVPWTAAGGLGLFGYTSRAFMYEKGFDCQDGGWSPVNAAGEIGESLEKPKQMNAEEKKKFEEASEEERAAILRTQALEGPHQQEPNQEGLGELGDNSPGLADLIVNQVAEEQANTVTDPLLESWKDTEGNEVTDECRDVYDNFSRGSGGGIQGSLTADQHTLAGTLSNTSVADGRYYLNNVFSRTESGCAGAVGLVARFTAPDPVNVSEIVGFDGMESTVSLVSTPSFATGGALTYATFSWNFGDGTSEAKGFEPGALPCEAPWLNPCAGSIFHSYQYGGTYPVTLTVTDVAGNVSSVTHDVTVIGPAGPSTPGHGGGSGSGSSNGTLPAPLATAAIVSRSLKKALNKGLVVRYSVNEKVAGHFEVLLSAALARRLHIAGPAATNLPAGTPAQVVIAKAIIVTTKGGRSTITIKFSKKTAKRLAHLHSASLMLRMVVRNAASKEPLTTVVLSKATLSR